MRILFCGNYEEGEHVLRCLLKSRHEIVAVSTSIKEPRNKGILSLSKGNGIRIINEEKLCFTFVKNVITRKIDLILVNNCKKLLKKELIDLSKHGAINLHSSLLPDYKGRAPISWAIINGERYTGITVHYINRGIDSGNIILQKKFPIRRNDDYSTLLRKNIALEPRMFLKAIDLVEAGYKGIKQRRKGKMWSYLSQEKRKIYWSADSTRIRNLIRALTKPFPGAITYLNGRELRIFKASEFHFHKSSSSLRRGEIMGVYENFIDVFAHPCAIRIKEIEDPVGNTISDLLGINFFKRGQRFENFS